MPDLNWQSLNLMQQFDVLRGAPFAHLAFLSEGKPALVPMHYQLEVDRSQVILHLICLTTGRTYAALRDGGPVCLEFDLPGCAWLDTVLVSGHASVGLRDEPRRAAELRIKAARITGRRYFTPQ